jgi:outer membrane protein TolC
MRRFIVFIPFLIMGLVAALSGQTLAGYNELKDTFDSFAPSTFYQDQSRRRTEVPKPVEDPAFEEAKKQLQMIKSKWEKSLIVVEEETAFLKPDTEVLKLFQPAAINKGAAVKALRGAYSLKSLEMLVLLRNPDIKAAENRFRGAVERFSQVSNLDEILRQYTAFTEGLMTGVGPMKGKDPVSMKFPFPGVLSLKGQIVHQEVTAEREILESVRRDAVTRIRKTYWNLIYIIKSQKITTAMVELLRSLETVANTRYEAGKTSYQDIIKVLINRETLEEDLVTLTERQRNLESVIREMLNFTPHDPLGSPKLIRLPDSFPSLDTLYPIALDRRQELRRLRARIGKMEKLIEITETMIIPPYTLNFSLYEDEAVTMVGTTAVKESFPTTTESSRGAGLPKTPWFGTEDAYLRETRQKLRALREDLKKAEAATNTMVRNAWFMLDRARRETALYRDEVVKLSRSALDVSTRGYESGNVSFADVIDSYTTWLKANLTLERNRSDLGIAWAELERVMGTQLNNEGDNAK